MLLIRNSFIRLWWQPAFTSCLSLNNPLNPIVKHTKGQRPQVLNPFVKVSTLNVLFGTRESNASGDINPTNSWPTEECCRWARLYYLAHTPLIVNLFFMAKPFYWIMFSHALLFTLGPSSTIDSKFIHVEGPLSSSWTRECTRAWS